MVGANVSQRVAQALRAMYLDPGFKIEYVEAWTKRYSNKVGKSTVSRILNGNGLCKRMQNKTARALAEFVEYESDGQISASELLGQFPVYYGQDLSGADFSGQDLSGWDFTSANLEGANLSRCTLNRTRLLNANLKGTNFTQASGSLTDLTGANLSGAVIDKARMDYWIMNAVVMNDGILKDSFLRGRMHGANLMGTQISGIRWIVSGAASMGLQVPLDVDFSRFDKGSMCHGLMYVLLYQQFRRHDSWSKISHFADFGLAQPFRVIEPGRLPCYEGVITKIRSDMPELEEDILEGFGKYPKMQIRDRLELADLFLKARSLEDIEALHETKYAKMFPGAISYTMKDWHRRYLPDEKLNEVAAI